jgi:hypothetical protein
MLTYAGMWSVYYQDGTQEEEGAHALRNKNVSLKTAVSRKSMKTSKLVRIKHQANRSVEIHSLHHGWTPLHAKIGLQGDMIMAFFEEPFRGTTKIQNPKPNKSKISGKIYPDGGGGSTSRGGLIAWDNGQMWVRETIHIDEYKAINREIVSKLTGSGPVRLETALEAIKTTTHIDEHKARDERKGKHIGMSDTQQLSHADVC